MGSVYKKFGYYGHPITINRFLSTKVIDNKVKMFGYNEHNNDQFVFSQTLKQLC